MTVEVELSEGKLDGFSDLLLLDVHSSDISVGAVMALSSEEGRRVSSTRLGPSAAREENSNSHVRPLIRTQHADARIRLRRQHIDERIRMAMQSDRATGLQQLPINRTEDPHDVIRSSRTPYDSRMLINRLEELPNDQGDGLDALDFLLRSEEFPLEVLLLVFDVFLLETEEFEVLFELFELEVEVLCRQGGEQRRFLVHRRGEGGVL